MSSSRSANSYNGLGEKKLIRGPPRKTLLTNWQENGKTRLERRGYRDERSGRNVNWKSKKEESERRRNNEIKYVEFENNAESQRLRWIGHVMRKEETEIIREMTEWRSGDRKTEDKMDGLV